MKKVLYRAKKTKKIISFVQNPLSLWIKDSIMGLYSLSIGKLQMRNQHSGLFFRNNLFVTDHIDDIERLKSPCRIDAVTIFICMGGKVNCSVNLKHYLIGSNMILVNFPDDIIQIHSAENLEAYAVLISTDFLKELEIDFRQRSDFYLDVRRNAVCQLPHAEIAALNPYYTLLCNNIGKLGKLKAESPAIIKGIVQAFSYTVISLMRFFQKQDNNEETSEMARNKQLFNKFMALVKQSRGCQRGVKYYADKLCITPNYLSGSIKDYTGKLATEWVNEYVIMEAKILLKDSDISIQQIAYRLKFPSQSSFGKYFKLQVGIGPREFRNITL